MPAKVAVLGLASLLLSAAGADGESFCQRLAPQLAMKQDVSAAALKQVGRTWKVDLVGGLGGALFGGIAVASFSVSPIGEATLEDYQRAERICTRTPKGMVCNLDGPARLTVGTKKGETSTDVLAGERAMVEMHNTIITCREP